MFDISSSHEAIVTELQNEVYALVTKALFDNMTVFSYRDIGRIMMALYDFGNKLDSVKEEEK